MLMGLNAPLKAGETVEVTLQFENAGTLKATAKVAALGSNAASQ